MRVALLGVAMLGCSLLGNRAFAADADVKLNGTFVWSNQKGKSHDVTGTFTPSGDKKWAAVFNFKWSGKPQTWKGTAEGTLKDGEIKGDIKSEDGKRNFNFTGNFKDGKFECTHNELSRGKPQPTGTMTLQPPGK